MQDDRDRVDLANLFETEQFLRRAYQIPEFRRFLRKELVAKRAGKRPARVKKARKEAERAKKKPAEGEPPELSPTAKELELLRLLNEEKSLAGHFSVVYDVHADLIRTRVRRHAFACYWNAAIEQLRGFDFKRVSNVVGAAERIVRGWIQHDVVPSAEYLFVAFAVFDVDLQRLPPAKKVRRETTIEALRFVRKSFTCEDATLGEEEFIRLARLFVVLRDRFPDPDSDEPAMKPRWWQIREDMRTRYRLPYSVTEEDLKRLCNKWMKALVLFAFEFTDVAWFLSDVESSPFARNDRGRQNET